jgi:hypothetical protein
MLLPVELVPKEQHTKSGKEHAMGLGPWDQAEQNRMLIRSERQRFHKIVDQELKKVPTDALASSNQIIEILSRIKNKITPKKPKKLGRAKTED